jgi:hypothetical protein
MAAPKKKVGNARVRAAVVKARAGSARPGAALAAMTRPGVLKLAAEASTAQKANAARAVLLLQKIEARKARIAQHFWFMGVFLRELLRRRLYLAIGFDSFESMLAQHRVVSLTLAKKLIAIADRVPKSVAMKLGQEKSYALVEYINATAAEDSVKELLESNALVQGKPVNDASVREVREAAKKEREESPAARVREARARKAEAKLREILAALGVASPSIERSGRVFGVKLSIEEVEGLALPEA